MQKAIKSMSRLASIILSMTIFSCNISANAAVIDYDKTVVKPMYITGGANSAYINRWNKSNIHSGSETVASYDYSK